ncbi:MAG TPA: FlgD immunoglobulin-like domain containing protein [Bacteroidales bacterium]|nr:FlgD immunoglobulin-like domain containing protein [Bacteroidales bacterium]HNS46444.1 FlgD immunoglobulin-like domain containing protein [Bacteroidales bacterium]
MKKSLVLLFITGMFLISAVYLLVRTSPENKTYRPVTKVPKTYPGDWIAYQRAYPYGQIKTSSYLQAFEQAAQMQRSSSRSGFDYELMGPTNIGGRITDIAVHPDSPYTWYIGASTGGIFKTTDGGSSWENVFLSAPLISIGDLEIDPTDENIIYAGTGEANSSSFSFLGNGIYKSTDAGQTWAHLGLDYSAYIGRIVVDYDDPQRIFAAACGTLFTPDEHRGVYRSQDGGNTWEKVLFVTDSTSAIDIVQHPENPDILFAAMWERIRGLSYRTSFGLSSGVYKSTDGGDTWTEITDWLPSGYNVGRIGIDIAKSSPNVMYAFYDMANEEVRVYRSDDTGESWYRTNDNALQEMNSNFGWYFGQIRVDIYDANKVYVYGVEAFRSTNGGNSWSTMGGWDFHVDHHAMYMDKNISLYLEGNDGGLYMSTNYSTTWTKVNNLPITQFYAIEIDYQNPERIYGGTQDNNTIRTYSGSLDDWEALLGGDGFYTLVDYTNSNIIYAEYQYGQLYKSTDGGNDFNYIAWSMGNDRTNWSSPLVMHPVLPNTLYFGTYRVWKTLNGGSQWTAVSSDLTDGDDGSGYHTVSTLDISRPDPDIILAGTDDGHVHISLDAGATWNEISEGLPKRWITRVKCDPVYSDVIYATLSGFRWDEPIAHVYRSNDLGQTWENISGNLPELPVNAMAIDPDVADRYLVGTDAGLFLTEDGGESWWGVSGGLGNVPIYDLKILDYDRALYVGTYGLSIYRVDLDDLAVGTPEQTTITENDPAVTIYPNPVSLTEAQSALIEIAVKEKDHLTAMILDERGRRVISLFDGSCSEGTCKLTWNGKNEAGERMRPGLYFLQVSHGSRHSVSKIVVL